MNRFLFSILIVSCMTPFMFGCGEEAPMTEGDDTQQVDEVTEEEAEKQAKKNVQ
ncbi:hypothetical protein [Gimesia aquarii]|uniref:Uncharacterized protein n=1 Tax=Gimesia aquarii TaxID=2527964 RepID=A0A517WRG6_9PLAN|nr:hypothetical protein [Gimesia aquarii]QDU07842.1 hypothetical protein V202x_12030 [Gimesia aquarii]